MNKRPNTFRFLYAVLAVVLVPLLLTSCRDRCETTRTFTEYTPVYMSYEDFRAADVISGEAPQAIKNPGKIYLRENLIFINEYRKGIHVVDNSDPSAPSLVSFISIPGNVDMAVMGNVLYADSHTDLLTIAIDDLNNPRLLNRQENVLPAAQIINGVVVDPTQGVVVDFIKETKTETVFGDCNGNSGNRGFFRGGAATVDATTAGTGSGAAGTGSSKNPMSPGVGGSMARFTLASNHLYIVTESELITWSLANPYEPTIGVTTQVGWGIETIFPYDGNLFIGSQRGMYVYDLSTPESPTYLSMFEHGTACDPVVVEDNNAYVTLRGGTTCGGFTNQLDILDVTDITRPSLIRSYPMTHPLGLGVDNKTVFVCDDTDGLKILDASDPANAVQIGHEENFQTYDCIPLENSLMLIGSDGFYQYDYSDPNNLQLLSTIPVEE